MSCNNSTNIFLISLISSVKTDIRTNNIDQQDIITFAYVFSVTLMVVFGLLSNLLSIDTFRQVQLKSTTVGFYLLVYSYGSFQGGNHGISTSFGAEKMLGCSKMLKGAQRCSKMLKGVQRCWKMLKGAERCWKMLKGAEKVLWGHSYMKLVIAFSLIVCSINIWTRFYDFRLVFFQIFVQVWSIFRVYHKINTRSSGSLK